MSDWSSDVCLSDLSEAALPTPHGEQERCAHPRTAWNPRLPTPHGEQERRNPVSADADPALPTPHGEQEPRCVPAHQGVRPPSNPSRGTRTPPAARPIRSIERALPTPLGDHELRGS